VIVAARTSVPSASAIAWQSTRPERPPDSPAAAASQTQSSACAPRANLPRNGRNPEALEAVMSVAPITMPVVTWTMPLPSAAFTTRPWPKMISRSRRPIASAASAMAPK